MLVKRVGAPEWIYAIAIPLGILIGFYGMIKFVLSATAALSRLEEQGKNAKNKKSNEK
jgi:mannose/fructose/N-acetylgalactosamine-specific phosphotransferase system component IIC